MVKELLKRARTFSFSSNRTTRSYRCRRLRAGRPEDGLFSRQEKIPGFDQKVLSSLGIGLIGAGGLGGEIGEGLVRKGVDASYVFDYDKVELSNLNRQFFDKKDIGKNKAMRLARNLSRMGFGGTKIVGVGLSFQAAVEKNLVPPLKALVCGVDNDETRVYVSNYGRRERIPVVFTAVSRDGNNGMVFVQEVGKACYGCVFPDALASSSKKEQARCAPDPAVKDILKVVAGVVLYAVDSLFMDRKRNWNYREIFLCGFVPDRIWQVERRTDCPMCGSGGCE